MTTFSIGLRVQVTFKQMYGFVGEVTRLRTGDEGAYVRLDSTGEIIVLWPSDCVPEHRQDSDCTVSDETGCCTVCGVMHDFPCILCGGKGFHALNCAELEPFVPSEFLDMAVRS